MIARPSARQLLECVREELRTAVAPVVTDEDARTRLGMVDSILASVIARSDDEVAWIKEEIQAAERAAETILAGAADHDGRLAAAQERLRAGRASSDRLPDLHAEYNLASELLSCALEAAAKTGGELRPAVRAVLEQRLRREVQIRGEYSLVGRT